MNAVPLCIPVHEILYFSVDFHIIVGHYIPDQSFEPELVEQVLRNFKLIHSVLDANNLKRLNAVVMLQNKLGDCIISLGWTQLLAFLYKVLPSQGNMSRPAFSMADLQTGAKKLSASSSIGSEVKSDAKSSSSQSDSATLKSLESLYDRYDGDLDLM